LCAIFNLYIGTNISNISVYYQNSGSYGPALFTLTNTYNSVINKGIYFPNANTVTRILDNTTNYQIAYTIEKYSYQNAFITFKTPSTLNNNRKRIGLADNNGNLFHYIDISNSTFTPYINNTAQTADTHIANAIYSIIIGQRGIWVYQNGILKYTTTTISIPTDNILIGYIGLQGLKNESVSNISFGFTTDNIGPTGPTGPIGPTGSYNLTSNLQIKTAIIGSTGGNPNAGVYPLYIGTSNPGSVIGPVKYFNNVGTTTALTYSASTINRVPISAWSKGAYVSESAYYTTSDRRIKKYITDSENSIDTIKKIPIRKFKYIDENKQGSYGETHDVIAQEIKDIYPQVISYQTNFVPNIYELATNISSYEDKIKISLNKNHELKVNNKIKIYLSPILNDNIIIKDEEELILDIIDISNNDFSVNIWNDFDPNRKIFVYGKQVDDFMIVDKVKLSMLGLGAIKELTTIVEELKDKIIKLQDEIDILKNK
jgi:hypothetical protein